MVAYRILIEVTEMLPSALMSALRSTWHKAEANQWWQLHSHSHYAQCGKGLEMSKKN
jgi:hypothetical protein